MISDQLFDGLEHLSLPVLDNMSLIQYAVVPLNTAEEINVFSYDIIRRYYEVIMFHVVT